MAIGGVVINLAMDAGNAIKDAAKFATSLGKVESEADGLDGSLRSAQTAMDQTGNAGRTAATDLGRTETALDQVGDEADNTADRLRRSANQMVAEMKTANTGIVTEAGGMRTELGEVGRESGAEFIGNIAEGIGSGQVNLNDVVSGTLGGITNLAATLTGPLGIAAAGAAAGIGLVFASVKAESEKAKAAIDTLRGAMDSVWEEGQKAQTEAIFQSWVEGAQATTGKLENTRDVLAQANVTASEFKAALAGDPKAMDTVKQKIDNQAAAIEDAKGEQGGLYDFQQQYLDNMGQVISDIEASDTAIGAVRREHEAIEDLSGKSKDNIGSWNADKAIEDAERLNAELDNAARDRTIKFNSYVTGEGSDLLTGGGGAGAGGSRPRSSATAAPTAAPVTNVTINMQGAFNDPLGNARHIKRLLEEGDLRNGRPRGQALAVAWG